MSNVFSILFQLVQYFATSKLCSLPFYIDGNCRYNLSMFSALVCLLLADFPFPMDMKHAYVPIRYVNWIGSFGALEINTSSITRV